MAAGTASIGELLLSYEQGALQAGFVRRTMSLFADR
jgi:hypothetical protein